MQQIIDPAPAVTQEEKNAAAEVGEVRRSPADCSESIDDKTVRETKERIRRLKGTIEDKHIYGGDATQEKAELEQLAEYLSAHLSRTGKQRKVDPVMEKVRKAVSNAIDVAIKDIAKQDDAAAGHFEVFIATGRTIIYKPGQPISWTTT